MDNKATYLLHGKLVAIEGKAKELIEILLGASKLVKASSTCHLYTVSSNESNPNEIWITEIWDDAEAHRNSLKLPGVLELISTAIPILQEKPTQGQELTILGG